MPRVTKDIDESREMIFIRDYWRCQRPGCFNSANQVAHRISQGDDFIIHAMRRWNELYNDHKPFVWVRARIIHHEFNLVSACCLNHNDFFNIGNNPGEMDKLLKRIHDDLIEKGII